MHESTVHRVTYLFPNPHKQDTVENFGSKVRTLLLPWKINIRTQLNRNEGKKSADLVVVSSNIIISSIYAIVYTLKRI